MEVAAVRAVLMLLVVSLCALFAGASAFALAAPVLVPVDARLTRRARRARSG